MKLAWICATAASVLVILSASVACEVANEAVVVENVRTVSGGGAEVLGPAISDRAMGMGPEGSGGAKNIGA